MPWKPSVPMTDEDCRIFAVAEAKQFADTDGAVPFELIGEKYGPDEMRRAVNRRAHEARVFLAMLDAAQSLKPTEGAK